MMEKVGFVYILTDRNNLVLYTGVTNNLVRRIYEHRKKLCGGFSQKYNLYKLVYFEVFDDILDAISREKQIKGLLRRKKISLILKFNPEWNDLYEKVVQSFECEESF